MIRRLLERLCQIDWRTPWTSDPRGGGPALDRALDDDELHIEAAERGLTGRDRDDWIEHRQDRHLYRISDALYPNGSR